MTGSDTGNITGSVTGSVTGSAAGSDTSRAPGNGAAELLAIRLLGSVEILRGSAPVTGFRSAKAQALFFYLAVRSQPATRAALLGLFWADQAEEHARTNLNQTLSNLRKVLGGCLLVDRQTAALNSSQVHALDVRDLCAAAATAPALDTQSLLNAAALYRGELLEGFFVRDAAEFDLWLEAERQRIREAATTLLETAARRAAVAGDATGGEMALRALLRIEPWREAAHRQLMLLLAASGRRDAALAQYAACRQALDAALDVPPDAETDRLHAAIRRGELGQEDSLTGFTSDEIRGPRPEHPAYQNNLVHPVNPVKSFIPQIAHEPAGRTDLPHNLPAPGTPFVGRARELAEVMACLGDADCRLLTLAGPGGIGKSRLALQAAHLARAEATLAAHLADGIFFVALAAVDTVGGVLAAVAEAVGLQFYGATPAAEQLAAFLADKRLLLVLDNLEQLMAGGETGALLAWLSNLLAAAPHVKLLATTRASLPLQEAWFYPLAGLALPPATHERTNWTNDTHSPAHPLTRSSFDDLAALEQSDAVQLFVQSARRARVGFSLSTTYSAVAEICRLVDGAPLALELAAAWLKVLTAEQVAAELARSLDILTAQHQNVPARHRSMRAVCEASWQLLAPALAGVMGRLAVHRGGFRLEAATAVAGASLFDLAALVDKSLLRQADDGRYAMHELLRQYALERLATSGELEAVRRHHAAYYLGLLAARGAALAGSGQREALDELAAEHENLHAAWRAAVEAGALDLVAGAQAALYDFLQVRSRYWEGQELFTLAAGAARGQARARLRPVDPRQGGDERAHARARVTGPEGRSMLAAPVRGSGRSITGRRGWGGRSHARLQARAGAFTFYLGQYAAAAALLKASLAQARRQGETADAAFALNLLGQIAGWQGDQARARGLLGASLRLCRQSSDRAGQANALHKLAQVHGSVGEYAAARAHAEASLALCRQVGRPDWIGYALDVLGWVTLCLGDYAACTAHYTASLQLFRASGDRLGTALALGGLGSVEWARGGLRLLPAAAYMTESLNLCRAIGHRHHAASRLWYLGQIAAEQEDYALARAYGEEGKALAEAVGSRVFVTYNLCVLGAAAGALGERALAQQQLQAVLRIAGEVGHLPPLLIALIELARLCLGTEAAPAEQQMAAASLAAVMAHPACWAPYRVRAQQVAAALAAAGAPVPRALSLEEVVAAWLEVVEPDEV